MATTTPVLKLVKPAIHGEETDNVWGYDLNANFDKIDAAVSALGGGQGALVSIGDTPPPSPVVGQLFWESDTGALFIFYNDGNSQQWVQINGPIAGTSGQPGGAAPSNTVPPAIIGNETQGQTLTVANGTWSNSPTSYAYQWFRASTAISGATASTYLLQAVDVGAILHAKVTAVNAAGSTVAQSNSTGAIAAPTFLVPVNTVLPAITGTQTEGQTLTSSTGTWTNNPTGYTYQWFRAAAAISGATAVTYLLQLSDVGAVLHCKVTATNAGGSATAQSNSTGAIAAAPTDTTPNAFSFTDVTNATLSTVYTSNAITVAGINAAAPISITGGTYSVNSGAYTSAAGTVVSGNTVTVRVTSAASNSAAVNVVLTIGGISDTYTVTTVAASGGDTTPDVFSFADVTGATVSTVYDSNAIVVSGITGAAPISITGGAYSINGGAYTAAAGTVAANDSVTVEVTSSASNSTAVNAVLTIGGVSDTYTVTTAAGEATAPVNTVAPAITGTPTQGQTLTVSTGTWNNSPLTYAYQWFRASTAISGAVIATYLLTATDVGAMVHCKVTATNLAGSATAPSNSTGPIG